jgi:hypothetical protein
MPPVLRRMHWHRDHGLADRETAGMRAACRQRACEDCQRWAAAAANGDEHVHV